MDDNTILPGYHIEYRLSGQITSSGSNGHIFLYLNNIATVPVGTTAQDFYRVIVCSDYFKMSDIILELHFVYSGTDGINLSYEVRGPATQTWHFYNVTIHAYITSDNIIYKWQRTA